MSRMLAAFVAVFLAFTIALPAAADPIGVVRGTITVDGKPAAAATVTLEGEGSKFTTRTAADGAYVFAQVPFGNYRLIARAAGAHDLQVLLTVTSDSVATVNVPLSTTLAVIGNTSGTATGRGVQSNPPSVNILDRSALQSSPVNNSLDKTLATLPGVIQFSYNEPVINGFHGVTYNIDGAPLPLATTSNFAEIVDPKSIDSIELLTGAIPAEYGGDRMGGVVNIISNRPSDIPQGTFGSVTGGFGNQGQGLGTFDFASHFGSNELFLTANTQTTDRGLDAPTFTPINDASSSSDEFLRDIFQLSPRSTLAFDYSNQLSQYQVPINVDPSNPYDPIVNVPGTLDTQREYDSFANLNWTTSSRDGNGVFQIVPWWRYTNIIYDGDLPLDVLSTEPDFSVCPPTCARTIHGTGLEQNTYAEYVGVRASDFRATEHHAWKVGIDVNRETATATQTFSCYYVDCANSGKVASPYFTTTAVPQGQAGSQIGLYAEDKWQMGPYVVWNYGLRYDHSTGYVGGYQISPRIGVTLWNGARDVGHVYYGKFYAAPALEDVRADCVVLSGACNSAHPVYDLKPESDSYFEVGMTHTFGTNFTGSFNVFTKSVVNILDTQQLLNTPLFAVFNNSIGRNNGVEFRLQDRLPSADEWFFTSTISGSYAACVSGSTFLFPPNPPGVSCAAQLALEDHSETVASTAAYTHRFGGKKLWFATVQGNYGSGFPVQFEDANTNLKGTLPAHTTVDLSLGRILTPGHAGQDQGLGMQLQVLNVFNHQYPIKVANGFNTTQIANGTSLLFRLTQPF
ncbi:MAG: TonB-dependent receptor [Candidatus Eremiobacteraeota bacterium]|nr:TonB-dependent receptor [Candidatus Eremiobacteraeota bacterium]